MNFRYKFFIFFVLIFIIFSGYNISQGYDDTTTHPALTDEIIDFYNLFFDLKITQEEKEWIIQGSHDEDTIPRWINHFYDPVYNQGWTGEETGIMPSWFVSFTSLQLIADKNPVSSLNWLHNQELQTTYYQYGGNRTWERAIYEIAANNNKKEAYYTLGFILHLIEDATVPEHTRNDTHAADVKNITGDEGSPYEIFTAQFNRQNFNISEELKNKGFQPIIKNYIDDYLIDLAKYSNNNFFSKDTIEKYKKPVIIEGDENFGYGIDNFKEKFKLIGKRKKWNEQKKDFDILFELLNQPIYYPILQDYFTLLSRQAIINGAGIINLFLQETETAKQNKDKISPLPQYNSSDRTISFLNEKTKSGFIEAIILTTAKKFYRDVILKPTDIIKAFISQSNPSPAAVLQESPQNMIEIPPKTPKSAEISPADFASPNTIVSPISNIPTPNVSNIPTYIYTLPPTKKPASSITDQYGLIAIPSAAGAGGGGEIAQQPQSTQSPVLDITPPTINSFSIFECRNSLSSQNCLIATTTINFIWNSGDSDLDYYEFTYGANTSTTTATSTSLTLQNNKTYSFSLRAKDKSNNWSATSTASVEINTMPIVINEIAWAGTTASSYDEWIELYNNASKTIFFNNFILYSETDLSPYILFSGSIPANSYYLIERRNANGTNNPVKDVSADLWTSFSYGLNNAGEILKLVLVQNNSTTTIDQTVLNSSNNWPAGISNNYSSMERIDASASGALQNNWRSNNLIVKNGLDANNNLINGTPKAKNSASYQNASAPDTTAPSPPVIISPSDFSQIFASPQINFQGTAEASSTVQAVYLFNNSTTTATTTVSNSGNWSITLSLNQATTTINFYAVDSTDNISSPTSATLFINSLGPGISSFSISQCSNSLSSEGCLTATTTLNLVWSSSSKDINYYELSYSSTVSTTTATSTALTLNDYSSYNFSLRAADQSGNWSAAATTSVEIASLPVVINEIAWAGNYASSTDEWIELYNNASKTVSLQNWILHSETDLSPYINLSGTIPAKGYYLIERKTENKTSPQIFDNNNNPMADLLTNFSYGLNNSGEVLVLSYASTTIDKTILCGFGPTRWCPGFVITDYRTTERINPDVSGEDTANWSYNNRVIANGKDIAGNLLSATPKARNNANYLIANGESYISFDITLLKSKSPYLVNNAIQVFRGNSTLTIEPGTVIKFYNDAGFIFSENTKIQANALSGEPIIFTSFYDDVYGGDTNGDATATSPTPGSWYGLKIDSTASASTLNNIIIRYGGKYSTGSGNTMANISLENASALIASSTFEYSKVYGLKLINSTSTISESVIRFNNQDNDPAGYAGAVLINGGNPTIQSNVFSNNQRGLYISNSSSTISSNTFTNNSQGAIIANGLLGNFSNNSGAGNGYNAIIISGNITSVNSTSTLIVNNLPYAMIGGSSTVVASSTLFIPSGVVLKSDDYLFVNGKLIIDGANVGDVIFTSLYDDSVSGDTTNNGNPGLAAAGQAGGISATNGGLLEIRGLTARYAGKEAWGGNNSAPIMIDNAKANIANSRLENNYPHGIYAFNSADLKIKNSSFENHNYLGSWGTKAALAVFNSTTTLSNVSFENNALGIMSDALSKFTASLVSFINNTATTSPANLW